jgi:hypothetical protein
MKPAEAVRSKRQRRGSLDRVARVLVCKHSAAFSIQVIELLILELVGVSCRVPEQTATATVTASYWTPCSTDVAEAGDDPRLHIVDRCMEPMGPGDIACRRIN